MAYGLYLALDQARWFREDFSDEDKLTGTIYTDKNEVTAKDLTGYTLTLRLHRPIHFGDFFNLNATIVVAADGTWSIAITEGVVPPRGIYFAKMELKKSGTLVSTLNREELFILGGPSGS